MDKKTRRNLSEGLQKNRSRVASQFDPTPVPDPSHPHKPAKESKTQKNENARSKGEDKKI